ncbi:MAG: EamA family transporter [Sedimenticola sp.]|nr:MAG: EamA family transporter [Sedimenticola sp.]
MLNLKDSPPVLLALTTLFWGGNAVVGKIAVDHLSGTELSFWRWVIAFVVLFPFAYKAAWKDMSFYRANFGMVFLLAFLSVSVYNTFQYLALQWTMAINVGVVAASMPLMVFLMTWMLGQERTRGKQRLGAIFALLGVVIIISRGDLQVLMGLEANPGDLLMLAAVFSFALYSVLLKRMSPDVDKLGLLLVLIFLGIAGIFPFYLWDIRDGARLELYGTTAWILCYVGIFPSILSYFFCNKAVALGGANQAGMYCNLISVYASVLAVIFLNEKLSLFHLLGMGTIFIGIFLATAFRPKTLPG